MRTAPANQRGICVGRRGLTYWTLFNCEETVLGEGNGLYRLYRNAVVKDPVVIEVRLRLIQDR